jgi:hypothetical protein
MAYGNPQRLYVIEFEDGTIKVGVTSRSEDRMKEHARSGAIKNKFIAEQFISNLAAEAELIKRIAVCGTIARGREYFTGVVFAEAVEHARAVAVAHEHANPISKRHLIRKYASAIKFSDEEIAVLDAYCARFGMSRAAAARKLAMEAIVGMGADEVRHGNDLPFFARSPSLPTVPNFNLLL